MNWTKTPPTKPGAYWWRRNADMPASLCKTEIDPIGILDVWGEWGVISVALRGGEWCGPLVPVDEVRRAYYEGHISAISSDPDMDPQEHSWPNSRARKVVEGEV